MSTYFGMLGILGFVFGLLAYRQVDDLKKRVAQLEAAKGTSLQ
jgi:hypothetical protein